VQKEILWIIAAAALVLLVGFIGVRLQMKTDAQRGRHYKWWQYIEPLGVDLKRTDYKTARWLYAFAIAFTALWAWLIWREFHP
jgi:hypothetical protein